MTLVERTVFVGDRWLPTKTTQVADFSNDARPAYRVTSHCRNCGWTGEARFKVGVKIKLWHECPQCETYELRAGSEFLGRDEKTRAQEDAEWQETYLKWSEAQEARR